MDSDVSSALVNPPSDSQVIWRYLSYPKLFSLLEEEELRFTRADEFTDPLEGYVPLKALKQWAEQAQEENKETTRAWNWGGEIDLVKGMMERNPVEVIKNQKKCAFISCWNGQDDESLDLWKDYTPGGEGVVIKSTVGRLKDSMESLNEDNFSIARVHYRNFSDEPGPYMKDYTRYPFIFKDKEYRSEQEIRALIFEKPYDKQDFQLLKSQDIVDNEDDYEDHRRSSSPIVTEVDANNQREKITPDVDLDTLIEEIRISPFGSGWQVDLWDDILSDRYNPSFNVQMSSLHPQSRDSKPSVDTTPEELYSEILSKDFLTLEDLA